MTKKKDIDLKFMKINPFAQSFRISVLRKKEKRYQESGKIEDVTYDMETGQNVKLFYAPDERDENTGKEVPGTLQTVSRLSPGARSLFFYVLTHLRTGQDWIRINRQLYMEEFCVRSINTVKSAEVELCEACLLAVCPRYKDVFWINPKFFFSGSRVKKFPNNIDVFVKKNK